MGLESLSPNRLLNKPTFGHGKCVNRIQSDIPHKCDCRVVGTETPLKGLHGSHHAQVVPLALPLITTEHLRRAPISTTLMGPNNRASQGPRVRQAQINTLTCQWMNRMRSIADQYKSPLGVINCMALDEWKHLSVTDL